MASGFLRAGLSKYWWKLEALTPETSGSAALSATDTFYSTESTGLGYREALYVQPFWYNTAACDGRTDGQTDRHAMTANTALA